MTSPIAFLKETRVELKQVKWPTRSETIRLTSIVLAISAFVGVYVGGLDFILTKVFEVVIK